MHTPTIWETGPDSALPTNELEALEQNWDKGKYDTREFDNTVSAVQMVLNDNRLIPHDGDVLSADLSRLLEFRAEYY